MSSAVLAQSAQQLSFAPTVQLIVQGPEVYQSVVRSYLTNALRSVEGVRIVDDESATGVTVRVVVIETNLENGKRAGVAISSVVTTRLDPKVLEPDWSAVAHPGLVRVIYDRIKAAHVFEDMLLQVGPSDSLKLLCEGIAAAIDTGVFERARAMQRVMNDSINKLNQGRKALR